MARRKDETGRPTAEAVRAMRADRLSRVLDEVQRLCAELDEMSRRQGAELDAGRAEDAAALVAERARLVLRLGEAARELGPDAVAFERAVSELPIAMATRARDQAAAIAGVVGQVLARDAEDREMLAAERDRLASEMADIGRGRTAIGAYAATPDQAPTMQDRRG